MIRIFFIFLLLFAGPARAEMTLADLVGNWAGTGMYYEGLSKAKMKCRLTGAGNSAHVTMTGRCGSSLGAEDVDIEFSRQGDGSILLISGDNAPSVDTEIDTVSGRLEGNQMFLQGQAKHETFKMQFAVNADGSLRFATERKWQTGKSRSIVTLQRR